MDKVLQDLFAYAFLVVGDRHDAIHELLDVLRSSGSTDFMELLTAMARQLDRGQRHTSIRILDATLRADQTRPLGNLEPPQIDALAWELKRTCLAATLGCLTPSLRQGFVLCEVRGLTRAEAAEILGISTSAVAVRVSRATERLTEILAVRCQHYDRAAPCRCVGRVGTALNVEFIDAPPAHDTPDGAHDADGPVADVGHLYRTLPQVRLSPEEVAGLIAIALLPSETES